MLGKCSLWFLSSENIPFILEEYFWWTLNSELTDFLFRAWKKYSFTSFWPPWCLMKKIHWHSNCLSCIDLVYSECFFSFFLNFWKFNYASWFFFFFFLGLSYLRFFSLFTFMHWRRKWQPTPVFSPGESQGWGSLVGCRLWGCTESDMTEVI